MKTCGSIFGGCLVLAVVAFLGFVGIAYLASQMPPPPSVSTAPPAPNSGGQLVSVESGNQFHLIQGNHDPTSMSSYMELFYAEQRPSTSDLKEFASNRRSAMRSQHEFYTAVVFDNEKNAKFPSNPFTAFYGMDEIQKHIVAHYSCTNFNEFSQLTIGGYDDKAKQFQIK